MKTINRWLSMLLVVAMLLSFTGTVAYAADSALTYAVGSASVDVSTGTKEVTVPVSLTSNAFGLAGAKLALEYDETALTFTGASAIVQDFSVTVNTAQNAFLFDNLTNYTGTGEAIFSLTFAVKDSARNGDYTVKLAATEESPSTYWNEDGISTTELTDNVSFTPGTITVSGVAAQPKVTSLVLKKTTTDTDLTELKLSISKIGTVYSSSVRAEFEAEDGADTTVTWESSDETVAAVENKVTNEKNFCRITTKGLGTAIITAHCGDLTASFTLTISAQDSTEITVADTKGAKVASFTLKSDDTAAPTVQLTTKPKYDLTVLENVQWSSSNEDVATVDENGLVTVTGMGSAKITATGTCAGSGTVAKGTFSVFADPDSSELPTITVKRGDKVISDRSGYNAEELILPIGSTVTLKAEMDKTSFTWMGKTYSYKLAAETDWVYSDTGASGTVTLKDNGDLKVTAASYSTAGKKLSIKVYAEGASNAYVYCSFRLITKTSLTQAEDGYFEIYDANDLKEFADLVNNTVCENSVGGQPEKNLNLRLMNDIDMTPINDTYIPIGSAINGKFGSYASNRYYSWCGDFDGGGHRIYNINYTAKALSNVTLFWNSGVIFTTAGSCHDLTVEGKVQTADNWTTALCGVGQCGKYENVISKLEINAGKASSVSGIGGDDQKATFINCVNYSNITSNSTAKYGAVAGIAKEGAIVENCRNYGRLECTNPDVQIAGIVYYSRAVGYNIKISQCANYGEIIGGKAAGIVADFEPRGNGSVIDCYNWGKITGSVYAGGIIGVVGLQAYGNSLKMSGCYNYGTVTSDDSSAALGELIGKISLGSQTPTNSVERCFYNEDSGNEAIGTIDNSSSIDYTAPEFTAILQADFATLAEKLGDKFQSSCPAPVFTWQQVKAHEYGTDITYSWHLNSETGVYDACTASVTCTECGSPLTQALTVKRDVARTDCTQERTVTYTATGTINGLAASDTMTDILPAGTHEVDPAQWTGNENTHWHVCANCDVRVDEAAHSGGSATTTERARCEICGHEYGELLPRTYTVKFDANGGEGTMDDQIFTYDVAQALTANAFTRTDRTFACWKDANGNTYTDGQTLLNLLTEGTITLTAMWTVNTPTLKASYMTSTGKPYIAWNTVDGADKYEVYRSGYSNGTYECIGTVTAANYTDNSANAGYTYYYKVRVLTTDGAESDLSAAVAGICHCARPVVTPDYLISTGKPYIKWDAVAGASKYEVYRSGYSNGTYEYIGTTTATNYTDSKANAGYTYYYKVKAISKVSSAANSYYSTIIGAACHCARPVVTPDYLISTGKPYIKWTAVAGASQYEVYRSGSSSGTYEYIGTTTSTNYTDSKANAGYTYYYKVKAVSKVSSAADSYFSAVIGATCHCARPVVKITTSNGSPRLTWNAVAGASQYEIYRATSQNGTYTKMYTTTALSYTNTSAKAGTTYYYMVKAVSKVNSTANSAFSTVVSITAK